LDIGSNPDPTPSEKQFGTRFESGSKHRVKHNLENGLNPDPNIRTDRLIFFKLEPCLKMDSKMRHGAIFLEKEWYLLGWLA